MIKRASILEWKGLWVRIYTTGAMVKPLLILSSAGGCNAPAQEGTSTMF